MLMLSKAHEISRSKLAELYTPPPTESWTPVPHAEVVATLTNRAQMRGLKIRNERFSILPGVLYPKSGQKIELPGARLFGSIDFEPIPGMPFPSGCTPSAGIRNSNDKSHSLAILSGARVYICSNGVLQAEFIVKRKHSSGLNVVESIDEALDQFMDSTRSFHEMYTRLNDWKLTKTRAHSLIIEMARSGGFASSEILAVAQEFENPRHIEWKERNAWNLYQACTEVATKSQSPTRQVESLKALTAVLTANLN